MGTPEIKDSASQTPDVNQAAENQVDYEKRYKDTQGAYTKSQQELKAAQAKLNALEKLTQPKIELDESTKTELDELKFSDPDAWRAKLDKLEKEAKQKHVETLDLASQEALRASELERRQQVLADYNMSHPELPITEEVIKFDVPPRITTKLESGELDFDTFLVEVSNYLKTPKVVGDSNKTLNQPNLGKVGGDNTPTKGTAKNIAASYNNIVY